MVSLARMVALYARKTLDKGAVRVGNWESVPLSPQQKACECTVPVIRGVRCG